MMLISEKCQSAVCFLSSDAALEGEGAASGLSLSHPAINSERFRWPACRRDPSQSFVPYAQKSWPVCVLTYLYRCHTTEHLNLGYDASGVNKTFGLQLVWNRRKICTLRINISYVSNQEIICFAISVVCQFKSGWIAAPSGFRAVACSQEQDFSFIFMQAIVMHTLPRPNMQKYTVDWSLRDQDTLQLSWRISKIRFLLDWRNKAIWKPGFFITDNRQGSVNSAYLVSPSAEGPTKPFSSTGLLRYLNFPKATISLELSCF